MRWAIVALGLAGCASRPAAVAPAAITEPLALYPAPRAFLPDGLMLPVQRVCFARALDPVAAARVAEAGLVVATSGCDLEVGVAPGAPPLAAAAQAAWDAAPADERFAVTSELFVGHARASLYGGSERALGYALSALVSLVDGRGRLHGGVLVDAPAIATRGLIEGYYGAPFRAPERACLLDEMARLKQNLYLYGPKDDPYGRVRWADRYPPDGAAALADAARVARARKIDFVWSVSPGQPSGAPGPGASISFASDDDFARLAAKIDAVHALGIDRFALLLDDIEPELVWKNDLAAFATPAAAHAALADRLDDYVARLGAHLLFVGPYYTSKLDGWQAYVAELAPLLHPEIEVLWTGPGVYSERIDPADLAGVDGALGRGVVIWDNVPTWPAPLDGRAPDLAPSVRGFLSNTVMIQLGFTFTDVWSTLGSLGHYQWNPSVYDRDKSAAWVPTACP